VRTTLTIDDDIAALLKQEMRRTGDSFKGTVNKALREGVKASAQPKPEKKFVVTPFNLNLELGTRYPKVADLLEAMEGPEYR
jgi:hypothetical protein